MWTLRSFVYPSTRLVSRIPTAIVRSVKQNDQSRQVSAAAAVVASFQVIVDNWLQQHQRFFSGSGLHTSTRRRHFSTRRRNNSQQQRQQQQDRFKLDALPFSVSPEQALEKFRTWAEKEQGLGYLLSYNSFKIGAAYVPVWSFDVNVRFVVTEKSSKRKSYDWKPSLFQVYGSEQSILHLPGLSAYAGYSYRRSLIHPVHSTTLVFMGEHTEPFGGWMLRDMTLAASGATISVIPDAWNATQGRAFSVIKEELEGIAQQEWASSSRSGEGKVHVQTEVTKSRRVYMPTFVIDYTILGLEYRAFVSGCDQGAAVSGVSHQIFGKDILSGGAGAVNSSSNASRNFLSQLLQNTSGLLRVGNVPWLLTGILRPLLNVLWFVAIRLWSTIPILGVAGGALAGFRKILQPWLDNRSASAEWERQRDHEAQFHEDDEEHMSMNDFVDTSGNAQRYFATHRRDILSHLSGDYAHEEGNFDWYKDWQEWARQQWERQQQQQQQTNQQQTYQHQHQQQQRTTTRRQAKKPEYQWDFDPNDPYSVLGIQRGASKEQVSAAFRKEMLKHHPDTQPNASEVHKTRSVERSKFITEAYRKIKTEMKR
jgi:hypothetical protein